MKTFETMAAQGDVLIMRISEIPQDAKEIAPRDGKHTIAHSETGHHHTVLADRVRFFNDRGDNFVSFLSVKTPVDLVHERSFDTHETLRLPPGDYIVRRQREYTAEGFRRAQD